MNQCGKENHLTNSLPLWTFGCRCCSLNMLNFPFGWSALVDPWLNLKSNLWADTIPLHLDLYDATLVNRSYISVFFWLKPCKYQENWYNVFFIFRTGWWFGIFFNFPLGIPPTSTLYFLRVSPIFMGIWRVQVNLPFVAWGDGSSVPVHFSDRRAGCGCGTWAAGGVKS